VGQTGIDDAADWHLAAALEPLLRPPTPLAVAVGRGAFYGGLGETVSVCFARFLVRIRAGARRALGL
jgi:hypothetical protein